jgi:hypothetical protein
MRHKQLGVSLNEETRAALEAAAGAAGHSIAEEIRERVERTFLQDALDPALRTLVEDVIALAQMVNTDTGSAWDRDPGSHAAFKSAISALLAERQPSGAPTFGAVRDGLGARLFDTDDPETVGRSLLRYHLRNRPTDPAKAVHPNVQRLHIWERRSLKRSKRMPK